MKRVILHCVPPFAVEYPSPPLKQLLQSLFSKYMWMNDDYYDKHMVNHAARLDKIIDETLVEKINFSDTLLCGFSMKMDGWLVSSIIAEKMKKIAPDLPIIIGGINTKRNAQIFLECFPQFDIAVWGEGETTLLQVANSLSGKEKLAFSDISNLVYRENDSILISDKKRKHYIDLSESNVYPGYSDYFQQKKELNINCPSIVSIEGSRGCHWNKCSFCYLNTDYKYRLKSVDKICLEIKHIMSKYQIYAFEFLDNDFISADFKRAEELLDQLQLIKRE